MFLGHFTSTYLIAQKFPKPLSLSQIVIFCIAVYIPDFIDKPLMLLGIAPSRGFGHTFLLFFVVLFCLYILSLISYLRPFKIHLGLIGFGHLLHLIGDLVSPQILFWPLLGEMPPVESVSFFNMIKNYYVWTEFHPVYILETLSDLTFIGYFLHKFWSQKKII